MPSQRQIQMQTRNETNASRSWIPTTPVSCLGDDNTSPRFDHVRGRRMPVRRDTAMGDSHRKEPTPSRKPGEMLKEPGSTPRKESLMQKKTTPSILPPDTKPAVKARIYPGYIPFSVRSRRSDNDGGQLGMPVTPSRRERYNVPSKTSDKDGDTPSRESRERVRSTRSETQHPVTPTTPSRRERLNVPNRRSDKDGDTPSSREPVRSKRNETQHPVTPVTPSRSLPYNIPNKISDRDSAPPNTPVTPSSSQRILSRRSPLVTRPYSIPSRRNETQPPGTPITPSNHLPYNIPSRRSPPVTPSTVTPFTPVTPTTPTPSSQPLKIQMPPASAIATPIPRTSDTVSRATHGIAVCRAVADVGGFGSLSSFSGDTSSERIDEGDAEGKDESKDEGDAVYEPRPLGYFDAVPTNHDDSEDVGDVVNSLLTWLEHPDLGFPTGGSSSSSSDDVQRHRAGDTFFERLDGLRGEICLPCD